MKFYSAMRKNRILTFATWMELEGIMLSEIRQADKYCMVLHTCGNGKNNNNNDNIEIVSRKVVASSWNVGETEIGVCEPHGQPGWAPCRPAIATQPPYLKSGGGYQMVKKGGRKPQCL